MYPSTFFGLFPPFPLEDKVFVAMSFEDRFQGRWKHVIEPAISSIQRNGVALKAVRVDARRMSDSIVTEILQGISQHRIVFADVTTVAYIEDQPIRNANVMYEVGIAHATRLPEEVVLFRSDSDNIIFDIANIRVNSYDPDGNPTMAKQTVAESLLAAIKEVELRRHLAVKKAVSSLDSYSWRILSEAGAGGEIVPPTMRTMGQALGANERSRAINRLLDIGALKTKYQKITPELIGKRLVEAHEDLQRYQITEFGTAIMLESAMQMDAFTEENLQLVKETIESEQD
jgi:hypothetical protein